jgi:hypothetical protein
MFEKQSEKKIGNDLREMANYQLISTANPALFHFIYQEEFDFRIELLSIDAIQRKARISFIDKWTFSQYVKSRLFTTLKVKSKNKDYIFAAYE